MYIARAVSSGTLCDWMPIPPMPSLRLDSDAFRAYIEIHGQTQYDAFKILPEDGPRPERTMKRPDTVHSAKHDAESVYWVMVVFLLCALPAGSTPNDEDPHLQDFVDTYWDIYESTINKRRDNRMRRMPELHIDAEQMLHPALAEKAARASRRREIVAHRAPVASIAVAARLKTLHSLTLSTQKPNQNAGCS